jgi:tRNA-specific 2-thiouridylase
VDSAVAASLLIEQGHTVVGATLWLWDGPASPHSASDSALTPVERARRVADQLGIPFSLVDAREAFQARVVDYFVDEYAAGRTPNPCVICNHTIKFALLLDRASAMGATYVATGHYARVHKRGNRCQLLRGVDENKDQSYFLHRLSQSQLARVLFPLGELTKNEVRQIAHHRGLVVAQQPESQDVCFQVEGDYRHFLARQAPDLFQPGPILDTSGRVLGQHTGLPAYTIGQRKGLGITAPLPMYVLAIDVAQNALLVGTAEELGWDECTVEDMVYIDGEERSAEFRATAQIRYRARAARVSVLPSSQGGVRVRFDSSQRDITPGQFLVLYDEQVVIGGGAIVSRLARRRAPVA